VVEVTIYQLQVARHFLKPLRSQPIRVRVENREPDSVKVVDVLHVTTEGMPYSNTPTRELTPGRLSEPA
jgi:hypothetical protein